MRSTVLGADPIGRHAAGVAARVGESHRVDGVGGLRGGGDGGAVEGPGVGDGRGYAGGGRVTGQGHT